MLIEFETGYDIVFTTLLPDEFPLMAAFKKLRSRSRQILNKQDRARAALGCKAEETKSRHAIERDGSL
jgi:hypothetical protein